MVLVWPALLPVHLVWPHSQLALRALVGCPYWKTSASSSVLMGLFLLLGSALLVHHRVKIVFLRLLALPVWMVQACRGSPVLLAQMARCS